MVAARKAFVERWGSSSDGYVQRVFGIVDNGVQEAMVESPKALFRRE